MSDQELRRLDRRWRETGAPSDEAAYLAALRRAHPDGVCFVHRCHHEGPSGRRVVVRLPGSSVLEWFQLAWAEALALGPAAARTDDDPSEAWLAGRLGGEVYGLGSIFRRARERGLPVPRSEDELRAALEEHLYVEGEQVFQDGALRVLTDDDEQQMAYFFFPADWAAAHPERTRFLLHDTWALPTDAGGEGGFDPDDEVTSLEPDGDEEGQTYLVFLTVRDSGNLDDLEADGALRVVHGVRLPDLCDWLREVVPDDWPAPLLALRAALGPRERTLQAALERCDATDTEFLAGLSEDSYDDLRDELAAQVGPAVPPEHRRAPAGHVVCTPHLAQLCPRVGGEHHQWILFDDVWAASHPDLARSLLRYARSWDPLA